MARVNSQVDDVIAVQHKFLKMNKIMRVGLFKINENIGRSILIAKLSMLFAVVFLASASTAQVKSYTISIRDVKKIILKDLPALSGDNEKTGKITVNNYYIAKESKPIIPITGEFHFSRYPNQYWDESIKKMKAGGINMIATYIFWNIHEEKEGVFNWTGDRDLRKFVELCAKNNISVIVRIGPFDHGEIRNGGLPDWLLGKPLIIRSNDPGYLHYVDRLYGQIGQQLKGLYYKDGGPIIAVQLENEYQHSASPWGLTYPGQPYDFTAAERDISTTQEGVGPGERPYEGIKIACPKSRHQCPGFHSNRLGKCCNYPCRNITGNRSIRISYLDIKARIIFFLSL
jgi:beta-galactosidase